MATTASLVRPAPSADVPAPVRRIVTTRTRRHVTTGPRPMVKSTAGVVISERPSLHLVPRRSRAARIIAVIAVLLCVSMLGSTAFQTQLPPRQRELDVLDRQIRTARERYDELRRSRAELLSPARLANAARLLEMVPVQSNVFVALDPDVVAVVQMSAGGVFDEVPADDGNGLSTNETVKAIGGFGR